MGGPWGEGARATNLTIFLENFIGMLKVFFNFFIENFLMMAATALWEICNHLPQLKVADEPNISRKWNQRLRTLAEIEAEALEAYLISAGPPNLFKETEALEEYLTSAPHPDLVKHSKRN